MLYVALRCGTEKRGLQRGQGDQVVTFGIGIDPVTEKYRLAYRASDGTIYEFLGRWASIEEAKKMADYIASWF